jgi:polyhydroxyalkanoate synthesis regulator phasin
MTAFPVVLDACVLFNAPVRDTLLRAAEYGLYRVHWSELILEETTRNLIASGKMSQAQAVYFVAELARAFPEALTKVPDKQIDAMKNEPGDRHVAACAVCAQAEVVVTFNVMLTILIEQAEDLRSFTLDSLLEVLQVHVPTFVRRVREKLSQ